MNPTIHAVTNVEENWVFAKNKKISYVANPYAFTMVANVQTLAQQDEEIGIYQTQPYANVDLAENYYVVNQHT